MNKRFIMALAVIMVFGMMIAGGCDLFGGGDQATPESTIEAFMKAMDSQDADALATLTGEDKSEFDFDENEAIKSYTIGEVKTTSDDKATATVNVVYEEEGNEINFDFIFDLTLKDGSWFVTDMDIDWGDMDLDFDWDEADWDDLDWDDVDWEEEGWEEVDED